MSLSLYISSLFVLKFLLDDDILLCIFFYILSEILMIF